MKAIEVRNLNFAYEDGVQALKSVNFEVFENERVFIIGPNGAGKSTLFNSLLGFLNFSGDIRIYGIPVRKENLKKIRSLVGIVFQDPDDQIFMPTVYEDVFFGPKIRFGEEEARNKTAQAMETTGLTGFENRLAHHLSFGEKKRVAIAGVLAMQPKVILLDEPTSNLDHRHRRILVDTLKKIQSTLVIATHDMKLVCELADRVIILNSGRLIAQGKASEILTNPKVLNDADLEPPCECELKRLLSRI